MTARTRRWKTLAQSGMMITICGGYGGWGDVVALRAGMDDDGLGRGSCGGTAEVAGGTPGSGERGARAAHRPKLFSCRVGQRRGVDGV